MIILQKEEKNCDKSHCGGALVLRTGERPGKSRNKCYKKVKWWPVLYFAGGREAAACTYI